MGFEEKLTAIAKNVAAGMADHIEKNEYISSHVLRNYNYADWKYEKIIEQIDLFQKELSVDYDVAIKLVSFGNNDLMFVSEIGYQNPDILYFYGNINGNKAQIIQHISQLNFLLLAIPREDKSKPPKRIGFDTSIFSKDK